MKHIVMPPELPPVHIKFTNEEVQMLLGMTQNPIPEEDERYSKFRGELFNTLRQALS